MNVEGYRCWLIIVDVMRDPAPRPSAAAAVGDDGGAAGPPRRRRVVYRDAEGAPRGAARFPALDPRELPAGCEALLFRPMGLLDERVYCAIAQLPAARAAGLFDRADGPAVARPRLSALQGAILAALKERGAYADEGSVFGGLAGRTAPLPAIFYFEPLATPATAAMAARGGGAGEATVADLVSDEAPFPFEGVVLFGRRPAGAGGDVELPLLVFYLLNEIAIYHWCRYCIDLLRSSDLGELTAGGPGAAGGAEAERRPDAPPDAYRALFAALREFRARITALRNELPRLRAEVASCRRFFARLARQAAPSGGEAPGGVPRTLDFNVEVVDDLLQQMAAQIGRLGEQAAILHEDARQNYQALMLEHHARLQARQLRLTRLLLALAVVLILAGPIGQAALGLALALGRGVAAALLDPLFGRLLDGLLPPAAGG